MLVNRVDNNNEFYIKWFMAILISSYFYCLPITRFSFISISTDLRLYDLVFIVGFIILFFPRGGMVLKNKVTPKYIYYSKILLIIILYSMILSFVLSGSTRFIIASVRFFRFFSFIYAGYIIIGMIREKSTLIFLIKVYFIHISIQAVIATLQVWGWIPPLWPDYWMSNYGFGNVATLSPHHKHIGVVMIIGLALSFLFIISKSKEMRFMRILAIVSLPFIILSMFGAHTRTGLFGALFFIFTYFIISANNTRSQVILLTLSTFIYFGLSDIVMEYSYEYFNNYIVQKIGTEYGMFDDRAPVYNSFLPAIVDRPWIVFFGVGYQNINYAIWGTGAHNNFAQVFFETGIIGLYAFIMMFYHSIAIYRSRNLANDTFNFFNKDMQNIMLSLMVAIVSTMFSGETFWGQYSMFTLSGQIFVLLCMTSHPVIYSEDKQAYISNNIEEDKT